MSLIPFLHPSLNMFGLGGGSPTPTFPGIPPPPPATAAPSALPGAVQRPMDRRHHGAGAGQRPPAVEAGAGGLGRADGGGYLSRAEDWDAQRPGHGMDGTVGMDG